MYFKISLHIMKSPTFLYINFDRICFVIFPKVTEETCYWCVEESIAFATERKPNFRAKTIMLIVFTVWKVLNIKNAVIKLSKAIKVEGMSLHASVTLAASSISNTM